MGRFKIQNIERAKRLLKIELLGPAEPWDVGTSPIRSASHRCSLCTAQVFGHFAVAHSPL
ncbi:MAG: hypothetical protein HKL82_12080 [Acidimicrobiaceae bacterium]|nr:hypothetical protein [Acidimicrobiaceae bacterium]